MADFHHRHAGAGITAGPALKLQILSVIVSSVSEFRPSGVFWSSAFSLCSEYGLPVEFVFPKIPPKAELQTHFFSPKVFRKAIPAMRAISERGASRSD